MSIPWVFGESGMWNPTTINTNRRDGVMQDTTRVPNILIPFMNPSVLQKPPTPAILEKATAAIVRADTQEGGNFLELLTMRPEQHEEARKHYEKYFAHGKYRAYLAEEVAKLQAQEESSNPSSSSSAFATAYERFTQPPITEVDVYVA